MVDRVTAAEGRALMAKSQGQQPETVIKKQIKQYLQLTGWFVFYNLQGVGAYKGIPDFICVKDGQVVFLEIKTATGKLSQHQGKFRGDIESHGGRYVVARCVEDVIGILER